VGYYDYDVTHELSRHLSLVSVLNPVSRAVGSSLSALLGTGLVILEEAVEHRAGRSVGELVAEEGLASFRAAESDELERAVDRSPFSILVLGEGALKSLRNRELVADRTHLVYLRHPAPEVSRRLEESPRRNVTFLLEANAIPGTAAERVEALVGSRESDYHRAPLVLDLTSRPSHRLAADLVSRLETSGALRPA
jgi:shikimate kinase